MSEVLLTLVMPDDVAQHVQDLLLSRPDLVAGFTAYRAEGHGAGVALVAPGERVSGHAPRTGIQAVGSEEGMRALLALIKRELPGAKLFFWLLPAIEVGRL